MLHAAAIPFFAQPVTPFVSDFDIWPISGLFDEGGGCTKTFPHWLSDFGSRGPWRRPTSQPIEITFRDYRVRQKVPLNFPSKCRATYDTLTTIRTAVRKQHSVTERAGNLHAKQRDYSRRLLR